ncbi:MAG: lactonase family protein [Pyrinomonadaceae bacterium]
MRNSKLVDRRSFIGFAAAGLSGATLARDLTAQRSNSKARDMLLYVGTYTSGESKSKGIYIHKFDGATGRLTPFRVVEGVEEPSFITIDGRGRYLYAVNETVEFEGMKSGAVSAFAIDQKSGDLKFLDKQPSMGGAPCNVTTSANGKFVLVANYVGGNVAVLPIGDDGRLGKAVDVEQHSGTGANKDRQEAAHAHSIILDSHNKYAFVNDLGIDRVMIYEFDKGKGTLKPNAEQPFYSTAAGAGPRHFKFHPNGKFAFIVNELDMTLTSLAYDAKRGGLKAMETLSTLPTGVSGPSNSCADLHVSPSGDHVYASNRGHDSIAVYSFDKRAGKIQLVEISSTRGKTPRNFAIDPSGSYLLAANQRSNSIVTFAIDRSSGRLTYTGSTIETPTPVCLQFHEL